MYLLIYNLTITMHLIHQHYCQYCHYCHYCSNVNIVLLSIRYAPQTQCRILLHKHSAVFYSTNTVQDFTPQTRCRIITRCRILLTDLVVIIHVYAYPIFERTCVLIYLPLLPSPSYLVNIHSIHTVPLQSMMFHPYNQHR